MLCCTLERNYRNCLRKNSTIFVVNKKKKLTKYWHSYIFVNNDLSAKDRVVMKYRKLIVNYFVKWKLNEQAEELKKVGTKNWYDEVPKKTQKAK